MNTKICKHFEVYKTTIKNLKWANHSVVKQIFVLLYFFTFGPLRETVALLVSPNYVLLFIVFILIFYYKIYYIFLLFTCDHTELATT